MESDPADGGRRSGELEYGLKIDGGGRDEMGLGIGGRQNLGCI